VTSNGSVCFDDEDALVGGFKPPKIYLKPSPSPVFFESFVNIKRIHHRFFFEFGSLIMAG